MKGSMFTGEQIFKSIKRLGDEVSEIEKGMTEVDDALGRGAAYNILVKARDEKQQELNKLLKMDYIVATGANMAAII